MFEIGNLTHADLPSALRLSTQAGWNQVDRDWLRLIDLAGGVCLAGRADGSLVATATLVRYEPAWAWVGMVLVDIACRGRGYGGQMMDAVLLKTKELGIHSLGLDATDSGRSIYAKRGFEDLVGIDRRVLPGHLRRPFDGTDEEVNEKDWAGLLKLDREVMGIDRSQLLQRLRQDSESRVIRRNGKVTGFGFRRAGRSADQIGPVIADSAADAQWLIQALTASSRSEPARDLLMDTFRDGTLNGWLDSIHFAVARKLMRMTCGPNGGATLGDRRIFAAAGFELG